MLGQLTSLASLSSSGQLREAQGTLINRRVECLDIRFNPGIPGFSGNGNTRSRTELHRVFSLTLCLIHETREGPAESYAGTVNILLFIPSPGAWGRAIMQCLLSKACCIFKGSHCWQLCCPYLSLSLQSLVWPSRCSQRSQICSLLNLNASYTLRDSTVLSLRFL